MGLEATLELCKESVPAATRKQLLEQNQQAVASGKKFDVRDALRTQTGDGGGSDGSSSQSSSGPPANPLKGVKHMSKFFMMVESKIVSVGDCVETICRDSDVDKIKAVREAFEDACTSFDNLVDTWKSQVAQSTKALQTVKSVK